MKKIFIILGIAVLAILAIFLFKKTKTSPAITAGAPGEIKGVFSVRDMVDLKKNLKCEFRKSDDNSNIVGSVIVSGGMVRGDFDIETDSINRPFASHFVVRDGTTYSWTSLVKIGFKSPFDSGSSVKVADLNVVGVDDKLEYACSEWSADLTRFNLPSGIFFKDLPK